MTQFGKSDEIHRRTGAQQPLQTITSFSRAVGLSASALRQYGERGLLAPADVEERTGYRYYSLDQQQRAIWIRRLRDAGLRLERISAVFEGDAAGAEVILDDWLDESRERTDAIESLVDDLKLSLRAQTHANPTRRTSARFDGMVLASAIRQVMPTITDATADFSGMLLEIEPASVAIVATDRFILLTRTNVPAIINGPSARVLFSPLPALEWVGDRSEIELIIDVPAGRDHRKSGDLVRFRDLQGDEFLLSPGPDRFPSVHRVLGAAGGMPATVLFRRDDVLRLAEQAEHRVALLTDDDGAGILSSGAVAVSGRAIGAFPSIELSGRALKRIADAAVGAELMCEVRGQDQALVWRSPSQPDFAALVMPRAV